MTSPPKPSVFLLGLLAACASSGTLPSNGEGPRGDTGALATDPPDVDDSADPSGTTEDDTAEEPPTPPPAVRINELMAANRGIVAGPGDAPLDWVELVNLDAEAVDLTGWGLTDDWREPHKVLLADGLVLAPGERVVLWLDPEQTVDGALDLGLAREGEVLRLFDNRGEEADMLGYTDLRTDEAFSRVPDGTGEGESMPRGTPGERNVRLVEGSMPLVAAGSVWAYLDGGVVPEGDMDGPWSGLDFDDSAWPTGPAPLGYGDGQATIIDDGQTEAGRSLTAYFRHSFEVDPDAGDLLGAKLGLRADDGARVWLDGVELHRLGLPAGEVGHDTAASRTVSGDGETTYSTTTVDLSLLPPGSHVLAVDLHQANRSSSDMTFDLWLETTRLVAEE